MSQTAGTGTQPAGDQSAAGRGTDPQAAGAQPADVTARTGESGQRRYRTSDETAAAGAGEGHTGLGGVLSMLVGLLAFLAGLAVVVRTSFYPSLPGYAYRGTTTSWGWVLLVLGVLVFAAGATHLLGMAFGRFAAIGLCVLLAVSGFLTVPYLPLWSIVLIALSVFAIWGLVRDGEYNDGGGYDYDYDYRSGSMSSQAVSSGPRHRM